MMHRIRMRGFIFIGRLFILKETKLVLVLKKKLSLKLIINNIALKLRNQQVTTKHTNFNFITWPI